MRTTLSLSVAFSIAVLGLVAPAPAWAQPATQNSAVAQSLYDDARKLMTSGDFAAACPKLEESQRLDATPSTLFHLADCWEHVGKLASAWAAFLDVAASARKEGRADRERVAEARAAALAPRLAKLTVVVPASSKVSGLAVKRDGVVLGEGQWNAAVPVDSGNLTVEASAPGKKPWTTTVDVSGEARTFSVQVPALENESSALIGPQIEPPRAADESRGGTMRIAGLATAGAGAIALGIGGYFTLSAISKNGDSNDGLCTGNRCNAEGAALRDDARSAGDLATVFVGAGAALAVTGVLLYVLSPKH